jgi:dsRNA-specific ribonuclease
MFKLFSDDHIQFIDENASKIKIRLSIDEKTESVRLHMTPLSKVIWSGKSLSRPKITPEVVQYLRHYYNVPDHLELQPKLLDQARIHPRFARHFNRRYDLLHQLLFNEEIKEQEKQLSYGNGLSFIGNAIFQFVASMIIFFETPEDASNEKMEAYVQRLLHKELLTNKCIESGWSSVLAYNSRDSKFHDKKGVKVYSNQLKGWLGALYASNSLEDLPEILEITKNLLTKDTELSFEPLVVKDYDKHSLLLGGCIGFGIGMFAMVLLNYAIFYYVSL